MSTGVAPKKWGRCVWAAIHYVALGYPKAPDAVDMQHYAAFYAALPHVLPCRKCRENLKGHYADAPFKDALRRGRDALFEWTVGVHNTVNAHKGRATFPVEEAWRMYGGKHGVCEGGGVRRSLADMLIGCLLALALVAAWRTVSARR